MNLIPKLLLVACFLASAGPLLAQGVTLGYQGQLKQSGTPFDGLVDLEFRLYDALTGGTQVGLTRSFSNVPVEEGLFQVPLDFTVLDFRDHPFGVFLEMRVEGTLISPRQSLTAAPYAAFALTTFDPELLWTEVANGIVYNGGDVGIGTSDFASSRVRVEAGGRLDGVHASTATSGGWALHGATTGNNGVGVHGRYESGTGEGWAVRGVSLSPQAWTGDFTGGRGVRINPSSVSIPALTLVRGSI